MSEAVSKLHQLARQVARRKNLLALQDALARTLLIGSLAAAVVTIYVKWQVLQTPVWLVTLLAFAVVLAAMLCHWWLKRTDENEAAFAIDDTLNLEDRFTTARTLIIGKPEHSLVEDALIADAAERVSDAQAGAIVPYRLKKFYAAGVVGVAALVAALMIPQQALPGAAEIVEARAEIRAAGEELEKNSTEIEKFAPPETVTAQLAKEQAELGHSFKRSSDSRAEALKKLGVIEERIKQRHEELKNSRADEVVALAENRLRSAMNKIGEKSSNQKEAKENPAEAVSSKESSKPRKPKSDLKGAEKSNRPASEIAKTKPGDVQKQEANPKAGASDKQAAKSADEKERIAENRSPEKQEDKKDADGSKGSPKQSDSEKPKDAGKQIADSGKRSNEEATEPDKNPPSGKETKSSNQQNPQADKQQDSSPTGEQQNKDAANPLTKLAAEQTAKVMPQLSEELMKKAADLRAGKMSPEELARLAQSAAQLAKDLGPLAQSKEFQKALEEMAKNINFEQLKQVAQELAKDEKLKQELQAAAKLLVQNQQVKEMIAGFRKQGEEMAARERQKLGNEDLKKQIDAMNQSEQITLGGKNDSQSQRGGRGASTQNVRNDQGRKLAGQGRESQLNGKLTNKPGGEYIYSGTKPGAGALRVPYSLAYPQYRREAERTVERSQVPTQMRSMVRNYFDAINPDAKKN